MQVYTELKNNSNLLAQQKMSRNFNRNSKKKVESTMQLAPQLY